MEGIGSVLVIDDEPVLQDVLETLLRGAGFDYHGATTAGDGLRQLREEEIEHINLVNKVMEKVEKEPDFDPDDFLDEPHAH